MNDLQRAAIRARPALAVLSAELGEPSPDAARALAIIEQMLGDIEAGRHPLDRPDDWPQRDRWPDRPHWDSWRWAIKALADACGATAHCSPKYHYMRVDVRQARSDALTVALDDIGCAIELASDKERDAMTVGTIDGFIHALDGKAQPGTPMSIEDMGKIAAAGWAGELESRVWLVRDGEQLIAHLSGGRVVRHHDAVALADLLLAAGVTADDVQMPDWREGDIAPSTGERIAIFHRMRQAGPSMTPDELVAAVQVHERADKA